MHALFRAGPDLWSDCEEIRQCLYYRLENTLNLDFINTYLLHKVVMCVLMSVWPENLVNGVSKRLPNHIHLAVWDVFRFIFFWSYIFTFFYGSSLQEFWYTIPQCIIISNIYIEMKTINFPRCRAFGILGTACKLHTNTIIIIVKWDFVLCL